MSQNSGATTTVQLKPLGSNLQPGQSCSTFGGHSITTEMYRKSPAYWFCPKRGRKIAKRTARGHTLPAVPVNPDEDEGVIWWPPRYEFSGSQLGFLVDDAAKVIIPSNVRVHPDFWERLHPTPLQKVALSTYRLIVGFQDPESGEFNLMHKVATAVHIRQGLFLTAAHALK
jgi:hypothetical protein